MMKSKYKYTHIVCYTFEIKEKKTKKYIFGVCYNCFNI